SSAWAADFLKKEFPKAPIFEMITPGAKEAVLFSKNKKIGIIGTPGTIKSRAWEERLLKSNPELKIYNKACPLLVPLVEEGWVDGKIIKEVIEIYLKEFKNRGVGALILACTHYPILEKVIKEVMGERVNIINPAKILAKELKLFLESKPALVPLRGTSMGSYQFFFSDQPYNLDKISQLCLDKKIKSIILDPF
ncbi:MAG: glutamate racemase, partial [Candidatus Nealsonbacteria bacterium]|nr:glutamate racemase [Candidatus Nealsonbacteria bacterium]